MQKSTQMALFVGLFLGAVLGCGGSSTVAIADSGITKAQFEKLQAQVTALQGTVTTVQSAVTAIQPQVAENAANLKLVRIFGTSKSITTATGAHAMAVGAAVTLDFGNSGCTTIGVHMSNGGSDTSNPMYSQYVGFQTCKGVSFNVSYIDGTLDHPADVYYDQPNCTGNILIRKGTAGASFSNSVLNGSGVAFQVPGDPQIYTAGVGTEAVTITSQSEISLLAGGGACGNATETFSGYQAIVNNVDDTGILTTAYPTDIVVSSL